MSRETNSAGKRLCLERRRSPGCCGVLGRNTSPDTAIHEVPALSTGDTADCESAHVLPVLDLSRGGVPQSRRRRDQCRIPWKPARAPRWSGRSTDDVKRTCQAVVAFLRRSPNSSRSLAASRLCPPSQASRSTSTASSLFTSVVEEAPWGRRPPPPIPHACTGSRAGTTH